MERFRTDGHLTNEALAALVRAQPFYRDHTVLIGKDGKAVPFFAWNFMIYHQSFQRLGAAPLGQPQPIPWTADAHN